MGMLLHCGGEIVSRDALGRVTLPQQTETYYPVGHGDLARLVREAAQGIGDIRGETYALNRDGAQAFGLLSIDMGSSERALAFGWRNSYDKSIAIDIGSGDHMFVCDNLAFSASGYHSVRRHTRHVWRDVERMVVEAAETAGGVWEVTTALYDRMKETEVDETLGYRLIGQALGEEVLTSTQANIAMRDWRRPRHAAFADRTAFSLYNCLTEGLKKGPAAHLMPRTITATRWFEDITLPKVEAELV